MNFLDEFKERENSGRGYKQERNVEPESPAIHGGGGMAGTCGTTAAYGSLIFNTAGGAVAVIRAND